MENNINFGYLDLLQDIMDNGKSKGDRTGTGTRSVFGREIRHDMSLGFPLITSKEINFQNIKTELAWFLEGRTDLRFLLKNKCYIWVGDAYKRYETKMSRAKHGSWFSRKEFIKAILENDEFNEEWGDFGPIYGKQWRSWTSDNLTEHARVWIDQFETMLNTLRDNPDSRRNIVSAWNVGDIKDMVLPPCHYGFQVYTRELDFEERRRIGIDNGVDVSGSFFDRFESLMILDIHDIPSRSISLLWTQRSVDTPLGLPYNIASYGTLLEMLGDEFNMVPEELIGQLGDVHIYNNQFDGVNEQLSRIPPPLPTIQIMDGIKSCLLPGSDDVRLINYNPLPNIDYPLSN